jgi:hypothetical protein
LKLCNSNYVQINGDEDFSNPPVVRQVLKMLDEFPDVGLLRGSISPIPGMQSRNGLIYADKLLSSGREALGEFSLTTNYISGIFFLFSIFIFMDGLTDKLKYLFHSYIGPLFETIFPKYGSIVDMNLSFTRKTENV